MHRDSSTSCWFTFSIRSNCSPRLYLTFYALKMSKFLLCTLSLVVSFIVAAVYFFSASFFVFSSKGGWELSATIFLLLEETSPSSFFSSLLGEEVLSSFLLSLWDGEFSSSFFPLLSVSSSSFSSLLEEGGDITLPIFRTRFRASGARSSSPQTSK